MAVVTMRQLLESGVHFGHQTRRWNPKMKRFIFTERNGIYIIDLQQSLSYIDRAYEFIKETVSHGGSVMFVGTKKQAQEAIAEQATRVGMPYVNQRWLGGMLTNFQTVHARVAKLHELERLVQTGEGFLGLGLADGAGRHDVHPVSVEEREQAALIAGGTQSFHLSAQRNHSLGNAFVLLRDSCDCPRDRARVDKALKLFVSTQAQQFLSTVGCVSLPQIEQNNFE